MQVKAVIETAVYVDDLRAAEALYGTALGLRVIGKELGRRVFFQAGEASALLAFVVEASAGRSPDVVLARLTGRARAARARPARAPCSGHLAPPGLVPPRRLASATAATAPRR